MLLDQQDQLWSETAVMNATGHVRVKSNVTWVQLRPRRSIGMLCAMQVPCR